MMARRDNAMTRVTHLGLSARVLLMIASMCVAGCGGGSATSTPPPTEAPQLLSFANPVPAGSPGFTANVVGSGFSVNTIVTFNGTSLSTAYQSSSIVTAVVPASLLEKPGAVTILARNGSATSNSLSYAVLSPAAAGATVIQLVSQNLLGLGGNGPVLTQPAISATGRFVAFQSGATDIVSLPVQGGWQNIYLRDTCVGSTQSCVPSTQLVSASSDGTDGGNAQSRVSSVDSSGRYVAFDSQATNLVSSTPSACGSTANCVYLRDTCIGGPSTCAATTAVVSIDPAGNSINGSNPQLSEDARFVVFQSSGNASGTNQIFLRDLCIGASVGCTPHTVPVSINGAGSFGNQSSQVPGIAPDGRIVGFVSYATNLINPAAANVQSFADMFVADTCLGATSNCTPTTQQVDVSSNGLLANQALDYEAIPSVSVGGRFIAFSSDATNLVSTNVAGFANVYLRDTCTGAISCLPSTSLVSLGNEGEVGNAGSHQQSMSSDGRFVAFTSIASNLVYGIPYPAGTWQDVYVRDTCNGQPSTCVPSTVRVAVLNTPAVQTPSNTGAQMPAISADGHYAIFVSTSTNLVNVGNSGFPQVFLAKTGF